jgi:hypothetical protein
MEKCVCIRSIDANLFGSNNARDFFSELRNPSRQRKGSPNPTISISLIVFSHKTF